MVLITEVVHDLAKLTALDSVNALLLPASRSWQSSCNVEMQNRGTISFCRLRIRIVRCPRTGGSGSSCYNIIWEAWA